MSTAQAEPRPSADPELRAVLPSIPAGALTTFVVCLAATPYLVATWDHANRGAITILLAAGMLGGMLVLLLPRERLLDTRVRDPFFITWTAVDAALIAAVASLDGGVTSPFTVLLFLTMVWAGVFYPVRLMAVAAVLNLIALLVIALVGGNEGLTATLFQAAAVAGGAVMCGWQASNISAQRRELARASRSDPLTGCLNRRGFEERLAKEVQRAKRDGVSFALVVLDLDDFKRVNDEKGHAAGDALLVEIVISLGEVTRGMDTIGRLGGDEFALLFPGATCERLRPIEQRVHAAMTPCAPCSLGTACFPDHGLTADELLNRADQRMYRSKGRAVDLVGDAPQAEGAEGSSRTTSAAGLSSRNPW
jgi:diguanylate cyclase (GGDEF)-like protein